MSSEIRAVLGYHRAGKDASVRTYARDTLAPPVKQLVTMLADIRNGKFDPESDGEVFRASKSSISAKMDPTQVWGDEVSPTAPFVRSPVSGMISDCPVFEFPSMLQFWALGQWFYDVSKKFAAVIVRHV